MASARRTLSSSPAVAIFLPSGEKASDFTAFLPSIRIVCVKVRMSQTCTVLSSLPAARVRPSGESARARTGPLAPAILAMIFPV